MPEDRDALLQHYRQMHADLLAAIDGLSDDQLTECTLDGWSVKDHLLHLALWDDLRSAEVQRISAGHASAAVMSEEQDNAYSRLGYELRSELSAAQARWEHARAHERLLAAIASATERGRDGSLYNGAALRSTHEAQHTGWIRRWRGERGY
jgi:uncharacterized damage-inducible protein DinB